ncbi:MAG: hypothetical protein M3Y28_06100 [Armatimonadota bacterium]|nr:hypothetical protein [Armatimonadota bacterium]
MNSTLLNPTSTDTPSATFDQAVVATYLTHDDAETAARRKEKGCRSSATTP